MDTISSSNLEKRLSSLTLEDLKTKNPDLAELAHDIVLSLPDEHAAVFEAGGSIYSLVKLAEKLGGGNTRKEKALAKKMEKLFALCADMKHEQGGTKKTQETKGGPQDSIGASIVKDKKFEPDTIMEIGAKTQKWHAAIRKAEKKNEIFKRSMQDKPKEMQDAMSLAYELNKYSIELYKEWAGSLGNDRKSRKLAAAYADRLSDEQGYRSSEANLNSIMQQKKPGAEVIKGNYDLLAPGIDKRKLDGMLKRGYVIESVSNHNCKQFVAAYAALRVHFGPDELDPAKALMEQMDAGPVFKNAYQQYFLVTASDPSGKVVGAHDGNYFGNTTTSALYGAHIGVYPDAKKLGIATLLHEIALTMGNEYATNAEKAWAGRGIEVDYVKLTKESAEPGDKIIKGSKLMYLVGEVEAPNLASMEDAQATIERNVIHARLFGFSVIPMLDYKQVDLDWPSDKPYIETDGKPPSDWNTVPLLLYVRRIGKAGATQITVGEAKKISRIMTEIFNETGQYSPEGVEADYQHTIARMKGMKDTDKVSILELPRDASKSKAQLLTEVIVGIIPEIETMDQRCAKYYGDYLWSKEYLKDYNKAVKNGTAVTLEAARAFLVAEATRKPEIEVKRD
ncbi:MAG: hypothetical protein NT051_04105 [Candidatus Micrarchaeota archaeon]|nr:hypothetical protein [Candidatus Micrarchaeota archaeon]